MSIQDGCVNFDQIVKKIREGKRYGKDDLSIWGDVCTEANLLTFLSAWDLTQMPFRIWEYVSKIDFELGTPPSNFSLLERGRCFGKSGDLSLRRDGDLFRWHFIGKEGMKPPAGYDADENNFWKADPHAQYLVCEESALLWGDRKSGATRWFEDRVARAKLEYPINVTGRVKICYWTFSRAGRIEFVWFCALKGEKEACNG
jgi:hypothetical protein